MILYESSDARLTQQIHISFAKRYYGSDNILYHLGPIASQSSDEPGRAPTPRREQLYFSRFLFAQEVPRGGSFKFGLWTDAMKIWVARCPCRGATSALVFIQTKAVILPTASAHRACFQRVGWAYLALLHVPAVSATRASSTQSRMSTSGKPLGSHERAVAHTGIVLGCRQVVRPWRSFSSHPETSQLRLLTLLPDGNITGGGVWSRGAQVHAWVT